MAIDIRVVSPKKITGLLIGVVFFLLLAGLVGQYFKYYWGHRSLCGFVGLFYGEQHGNIPHWFKALCMLIIAAILYVIYKIQKDEQARFQNHWLFLSLIFFLMNIVQSADIHNALSPCLRSGLGVGGWFYFAWVIPAIVLVIVLGLTYLRFFINLPPRTRLLFFYAGLLYVIGAVAFEMATAYYMIRYDNENFAFATLSALHEALKMVGLILFIYALLDFSGSKNKPIRLLFSKDTAHS